MKPSIEIHYCQSCGMLPRATWLAQELLNTFARDLDAVALRPGGGGVFEVHVDGKCLHSLERDGAFPEPQAVKQIVRKRIQARSAASVAEPSA